MNRFKDWLIKVFDVLNAHWENHHTHQRISAVLVVSFLLGLLFSDLVMRGVIPASIIGRTEVNHFFAIEVAFTLLLLTELVALVFIFPNSVARSVGKQIELLSLILLRSAFKELKVYEEPIVWLDHQEAIFKMIAEAGGSLLIFFLLGIYYYIYQRVYISNNEAEKEQFIQYKKLLALFLLASFIWIGITDTYSILVHGVYPSSFNTFYTILIFVDICLVLIALRYTMEYHKIFRYSAFVLTTVLIRIALSLPLYMNVILGVVSAGFLVCTALASNFFIMSLRKSKVE
ncbi:MAG: hypothetical protein AAF399_18560 [Bacteroidota bacterium]